MMTRERFLRMIDNMLLADRIARLERDATRDRITQLALDQLRDRVAQAETAARLETEQVRAEVIRLQAEQVKLGVELAIETKPATPAIEAPADWWDRSPAGHRRWPGPA